MEAPKTVENHGDEWGLTDTFYEGYINQVQPGPSNKVYQQQRHCIWRNHTVEHLSNYHKDHPNQLEYNQKLHNEKEHPL